MPLLEYVFFYKIISFNSVAFNAIIVVAGSLYCKIISFSSVALNAIIVVDGSLYYKIISFSI